MADQLVTIASRALVQLGEEPISTWEDNDNAIRAKVEIEPLLQEQLQRRRWSFAEVARPLAQLTGVEPVAPYQYVFQLPSDYLAARRTDPRGSYQIVSDQLHTNRSPVTLHYTRNVEVERTPPYFQKLLCLELAAALCVAVTGSANKAVTFESKAERAFGVASQRDGSSHPQPGLPLGPLIDARG